MKDQNMTKLMLLSVSVLVVGAVLAAQSQDRLTLKIGKRRHVLGIESLRRVAPDCHELAR
jgi:hypothetical protein